MNLAFKISIIAAIVAVIMVKVSHSAWPYGIDEPEAYKAFGGLVVVIAVVSLIIGICLL